MFTRVIGILFFLILSSCSTSGSNSRVGYYLYTVKKGDSFASIAARFGTTWQEIVKTNSTSPEKILVGMKLKIRPGPGGYIAGTDELIRSSESLSSRLSSSRWNSLFGLSRMSSYELSSGFLFSGSRETSDRLEWPVIGRVTSTYGKRGNDPHHGIDIAGASGRPIRAGAAGRVSFVGRVGGYGRVVVIDHSAHRTLYAHMSRFGVKKGDAVKKGEHVGEVGSSGNATGAHLHFEIRDLLGKSIDPLHFLKHKISNRLASR